MSLLEELKRRNVFRVAIGYAITAWLLLQLVDLVLENIHAPDWVIQVFMLALLIGFPLAMFFAWAFEMTPEGVKRETEVDRSVSIAPRTGRKMDRHIMIAMALALAYFAYDKFSGTQPGDVPQSTPPVEATVETTAAPVTSTTLKPNDKSIAVLPLVNRSVQAEDAFFADGLHDELLTQLSRISALKVISRTSVMGYAGTTKRMTEIGKELGVSTLLEGGVQRSGNRVRINVQLIEAATDEHLWAEVYDRELTADNLFDIQSDITRAIANALQAVLTGEEQQNLDQKPTDNAEAYAYYLRSKAAAKEYGRNTSEIDKSIASYQAAIALDPNFAAAYAALAFDWVERYWISDKLGDELKYSLESLQKAQALAPESAETLTAEGYYHYWGHLDYVAALSAFGRALEHEPGNTRAMKGKANTLRRRGRLEESIALMEKVVSLDPMDADVTSDVGYTLLCTGEIEGAEIMLNRAYTLSPESSYTKANLLRLFLIKGDIESARQFIGSASAYSGGEASVLDGPLLVGRASADTELVNQVLEAYVSSDWRALGSTFARALVYLDRGELDKLQTLITDMHKNLQSAELAQRVDEVTLLQRVAYYGLKQDRAKLGETVETYNAVVKPDALRALDVRTIPIAYAIAGDSEALLAYLEDLVEQFGPWEFYYFALDPSFNNMRDLPRFQALDKQYRQWLEQHP
jgi:TolB-like protein/Flp pilus assembly protein TadD